MQNVRGLMSDNTKAIQLLDEWFDEPDEMGEEFWEEYELVPLEIGGMQTTNRCEIVYPGRI